LTSLDGDLGEIYIEFVTLYKISTISQVNNGKMCRLYFEFLPGDRLTVKFDMGNSGKKDPNKPSRAVATIRSLAALEIIDEVNDIDPVEKAITIAVAPIYRTRGRP